ncbi:MAG TPA: hypothetical protein VKT54_13040 [Steroidobacteraceae bacterium]|nr:hypothetical protein [Steroidobacteraceae bacterium]
MSTSNRRARATIALLALTGVAVIAQAREPRGEHENRPERERAAVRREAAPRENHRASAVRTQAARPAVAHQAPQRRERRTSYYARPAVRGSAERRPVSGGGFARATPDRPAAVGHVRQVSRTFTDGQVRIVRYGNSLSGTVERSERPGFVSRTFVSGGHVLYTHVYHQQVWHQFGRSFAYETFVPAVRFPALYYAWALGAWPRPVFYSWGWQMQPWYPTYGVMFTPYAAYTSPDQWMTDYIIAQNMQMAYQAQAAVPPPQPAPQPAALPAPDPSNTSPASPPGYTSLTPHSQEPSPPSQSDSTSGSIAPPPAMTPQVKAELNAQIKVQLREQQAAQATPATLTTQSTPPALRTNHVFFEVVQPLDVTTANGHCSLKANDYIKRTGGMSNDDWMIPVVVELSGPSDCPEGLATRIGLNDLNAMENEQEAQVMEAMRAASRSMGADGPPSGAQPTLIADGSAAAAPGTLEAIQQTQ